MLNRNRCAGEYSCQQVGHPARPDAGVARAIEQFPGCCTRHRRERHRRPSVRRGRRDGPAARSAARRARSRANLLVSGAGESTYVDESPPPSPSVRRGGRLREHHGGRVDGVRRDAESSARLRRACAAGSRGGGGSRGDFVLRGYFAASRRMALMARHRFLLTPTGSHHHARRPHQAESRSVN